jgi:branched-chain amino acid transport system substrate-binding protein
VIDVSIVDGLGHWFILEETMLTKRTIPIRATAVLGVVSIAVLGLSACGSSKKASSGSSPTTSSSGTGPTYTIAYEGPLSGGDAQLGLNMKYAVELAVNQANSGTSQFGKLPFTLKFTAADDQGSGTISPSVATSLVDNSGVVAVVGPAFSGATKAAEPTFSAANLATVTPSATNPALATEGWGNFFRVVADDNAQGPADADYMADTLHLTSVYVVNDASAYAVGLAGAFTPEARAKGMKVTSQQVPGTTQCSEGTGSVTEYPAAASVVKTSGAQAVFYAGYYCGFADFAKALRSAGFTGQLFSDDGSLDPHYVSGAGTSVAAGTLISCPCQDLTTNPAAASFVSQFKTLAGFAIGTYSGEAYDATNTIISVMKSIAAASGASSITRAAVVAGLKTVTYTGLTKTIKFESNGDIAGTAEYVYKVEPSGTITEVGPA